MKQDCWTVYAHTHIESGRRYIGLTKKRMLQRWNEHVYNAKRKQGKGCRHFWNAIRKYGKDAFSHEVLEVCYSLEAANEAEKRWIVHFDTTNPEEGFNLAPGGAHTPHPIKNPWNRPGFREARLADLRKANASLTPTIRSKRAKKLWQDPEFREKITKVLRANSSDPEIRVRLSEINKEIKARPEEQARASAHSKAMWESEEYRARNSELWQDPDYRERCQSGLVHGAKLNKNKTHCRNGHEFTEDNTYVNRRGSRECKICRQKSREKYAGRKAEEFVNS
jgi:group I intron endonuclease